MRRADKWVPPHAGWRRAGLIVAIVLGVGAAALIVRLIQHPVISAVSPRVRVTVSGGCPSSLGGALDVANPGPGFWSELVRYSRLARSGATAGLVCQYTAIQPSVPQSVPTDGSADSTAVAQQGTGLDGSVVVSPPAEPPPTLQAHAVLTRAQAQAVSLAAFTQSTRHPSGTFHCPPATEGSVIIVVLSYPTGADADIWWNDTGCQNADNGHVEVYFYGAGLSGGDFTGALEKVFPGAP